MAIGTLVRWPVDLEDDARLVPRLATTVATICATACSMLLPVIAPKAAFKFTVTMPSCSVAAESTVTLLGMAV